MSTRTAYQIPYKPSTLGRIVALHCPSVRSPAIAIGLFAIAMCSPMSAGAADNGGELPTLQNTAQTDKSLSLEVNDKFVWKPQKLSASGAKSTPDNVWDVILDSKRMPAQLNADVELQMEEYRENAWWIEKIFSRSRPYLHYIVDRLDTRGLPLDLAFIPVIESSYQPHVLSPGSAAGLWQIVPITAKQIGLSKTRWFDARADLQQSTRAALDYLSYLNAEFKGDWELTLAAYNAGPGRVKKAMSRNRKAGKPVDFWSLSLPAETTAYVPKLIALMELVRQTPSSPFDLPKIANRPAFEEVDVGQRISLGKAAELAGLKVRTLQRLNAALTHNVTPPRGPHKLLVPLGASKTLRSNLAKNSGEKLFELPKTHLVQSGDSIGSIALLYGITRQELRELNLLNSDLIKIGQRLAVIDRKESSQPIAAAASTGTSKNSSANSINYVIKKGDTLSGIALKYNVRVGTITLADGSNPNEKRLIPGQRLLIPAKISEKSG